MWQNWKPSQPIIYVYEGLLDKTSSLYRVSTSACERVLSSLLKTTESHWNLTQDEKQNPSQ